MCGIVGIAGTHDCAGDILDALRRLEYRGYDSTGIATLDGGKITRRRAVGKIVNLAEKLKGEPLSGSTGIGHTRWATHGKPSEANAHPHATARVAVVHNGIIENFRELRDELKAKGHIFESETDTEVVAHLVDQYLAEGLSPKAAALAAVRRFTGAYALAMVFAGEEGLLIGARMGSPLAVGFGRNEGYMGSDAFALAPFTNRVTYLENGDVAVMHGPKVEIYDQNGHKVHRHITVSSASAGMVDKGGYRHFMAKEIHEQPEVISHTLAHYIDPDAEVVTLDDPKIMGAFARGSRLTISACGTAYYAGLVAKYWFEQVARLAVEIDVASELRYRDPVYPENGLALFISQSGETADTLAALREAKENGQTTIAVVNVPESTIAREADVVLPTFAGPEIGVASTKAFTCQLAALASVALAAAKARGKLPPEKEKALCASLLSTSRLIVDFFGNEKKLESLGWDLSKARDVLYLGRGVNYPLALEGALKLKEISYLHAEGYAAGEMKHGPIALIDENVPVIVMAPADDLFEKTFSNMQEVMARGGKVVLISDAEGLKRAGDSIWAGVEIPRADAFGAPILCAVPVQLMAYYAAVAKGTDVDQPRNLAKSVTVE